MSASLFVLILLFGIVGPLVLYALVRSEAQDRRPVDWANAERAARQDTRDEDDLERW